MCVYVVGTIISPPPHSQLKISYELCSLRFVTFGINDEGTYSQNIFMIHFLQRCYVIYTTLKRNQFFFQPQFANRWIICNKVIDNKLVRILLCVFQEKNTSICVFSYDAQMPPQVYFALLANYEDVFGMFIFLMMENLTIFYIIQVFLKKSSVKF